MPAHKPTYFFRPRNIAQWLPRRAPNDNKTRGGKVLILAGSQQMPGAAILAAEAASRMGAGYVFVSESRAVESFPEAILWDHKSFLQFNAVLIGPGLGASLKVKKWIEELRNTPIPVVIDADALTVASQYDLAPFPAHWIATPHTGELAKFLPLSAEQIQIDRLAGAELGQSKLGCSTLLKGFRSVIAYPKLNVVINTGNVALAKGGSGDVLAGMIVGLVAQKVPPIKALLLATYIHGLIADRWVSEGCDYLSMIPSDIIAHIPKTLAYIREHFQ